MIAVSERTLHPIFRATYNLTIMKTLIKNGTIVTASDQYAGDVLVEDEKITVIGTTLDMQADKVIDASGKYVLPGGIDVHTHLDMPFGGTTSADDFESGTQRGGLRRDHLGRRFRDSVPRPDAPSRAGRRG